MLCINYSLIKVEKIKTIRLRIESLRKSLIPIFEIPTLYLELKKDVENKSFRMSMGMLSLFLQIISPL